MQDKIIQTIVMRAKFPDKNGNLKKLRVGKYCSQAAHASIAFLSNKLKNTQHYQVEYIDNGGYISKNISVPESLTEEEQKWIDESFTKICLYVNTEEELLDLYLGAKNAGLTVHLIQDAGHTEFDGVPTYTCLAIGPHYKSRIDVITRDLNLF
jgi:peptidyl-tRNA hydrolase, PTH2 family